ncbi:MAG: replication initiator protein [Microvirus sp.]|nr:MAG: replication initiator protein [Microvirus sp.]
MTCTRPLRAYRSAQKGPTGRYGVTFNPLKSLVEGSSFGVPCGRCLGCMLTRSQQWAARCLHEAKMHHSNSFLTLTYDDEHLPENYSVSKREWQLFMYKLRKHLGTEKIRFFAAGEYGDINLRPHYHGLIFGWFPRDAKQFAVTAEGHPRFRSETLSKIWGQGLSELGTVTYQSAGYCARYCVKKLHGDYKPEHYIRQNPVTGKVHQVEKEFALQSRNPGLGASWFTKFKGDCFPSDFLIADGKRIAIPRYYALKLSEEELHPIKRNRAYNAQKHRSDQTPERLKVREEVLTARLLRLKRTL